MRLLVSAALTALVIACPAAVADTDTDVDDDGSGYLIETEIDQSNPDLDNSSDDQPEGEYHQEPFCPNDACTPEFMCPDGSVPLRQWFELPDGTILWEHIGCGSEGAPGITGGLVLTAFRRIPLPASPLIIQPPDGRTLVNFLTPQIRTHRPGGSTAAA